MITVKYYYGKRGPGEGTVPGPVHVIEPVIHTLDCIGCATGPESVLHFSQDNNISALNTRTDLIKHSEGFNWGNDGSGSAQLALALLADVLDDDDFAVTLLQQFKNDVVGKLRDEWELTEADILRWAVNTRSQNQKEFFDAFQFGSGKPNNTQANPEV